jgi:hypothetical protein
MPADTELKDDQPIQHGNYRLVNSALQFTPDTPFRKNKIYFLRYYLYGSNKSMLNYLKNDGKMGQIKYIDLIFKP